jgi:Fe2+ or Zn2+ uptake regulation protein
LAAVKTPEELTLAFRERGLKVTPQRQAIFRVLHTNGSHPSAEAVHHAVIDELPTVSLRTVYQTLGDLAEMGEILQLDLGTGAARFDPNIDPHHHLVCDRCGMVSDTQVDHPDPRPSSPESDGFLVTGTEIVFRGLCASCAGASSTIR